MALIWRRHIEIAEVRRVAPHDTAWQPDQWPKGCAPSIERHLQAVAGVEARAAHLGEIPARAEIFGAPLGVALETAAGEHRPPWRGCFVRLAVEAATRTPVTPVVVAA